MDEQPQTKKIKEISERLNISQRAIRFYEEKGLISPEKSPDNQYRLFTDRDIWRLQAIIALREVGLGINEIRDALTVIDTGEPSVLLHYLEIQRSAMFTQWVELKQLLETTDHMIDLLRRKQTVPLERLFELAEGSKRLREARTTWRDRWDFDHRAPSYDEQVMRHGERLSLHRGYEQALEFTVDWVNPRPGEHGLDFGVGTGNLAGRFVERNIKMAGVDQSSEMLKQCQRKFPQVETKIGSFFAVPFFDATFDFVVTSFAMHHITDEQKELALSEMNRVLKPHGRICIADVMFESDAARDSYLAKLADAHEHDAIATIEAEHLANLSTIESWFDDHGYVAKHHRLNDLLYVVYALRIQ